MDIQDKQVGHTEKHFVVVTGGAGYIGSHVVSALRQTGFDPIVLDDLSTGKRQNVPNDVPFFEADFKDKDAWEKIIEEHAKPVAVMHLAASLDATESVEKPFDYLKNNTHKTLHLLGILEQHGIDKLIFSSSAAVYGDQKEMPVLETAKTNPANPYGQSKLLAEELIDYHTRFGNLQGVVLRYFNVAGSLPEVGTKPESHVALFAQVARAVKDDAILTIYGNDFPTPDGTGIRDYVHVGDIARAHVEVLKGINNLAKFEVLNIGSGTGYSVQQIVDAARKLTGNTIQTRIAPRRESDVPISIASTKKIKKLLNFELKYSSLETLLKSVIM